MSETTTYILDANIFIQAKNSYYAFDICPGFWAALEQHCNTGAVLSLDRVLEELAQGEDELSKWVLANEEVFFRSTRDPAVLNEYRGLMIWAQAQSQFTEAARS